MPRKKWTGLIAAAHSPFHADGALNLDAIPAQAEHFLEHRITAAFVCGSTGESSSLTVEERFAITQRWVECARGTELAVIAHVGSNCQADSVALARHAARAGVAGVSALAPSYFKPGNVAELIRFMAPIAEAAGSIPFYYYDIPSMTGLSLPIVEFLEKAPTAISNLRGVKFTSIDSIQLQEALSFRDGAFDILFGVDECLLAALALGARGAVGSSYNFAAPIYHRVMRAFAEGDWATARAEQLRSIQLIRLLNGYGYIPAAKFVMTLLGSPVGPARSPLPLLTAAQQSQLESRLHETRLWESLQPMESAVH